MNIQKCSMCNKRIATIFVSQVDKSGKQENKGLCLVCAKKMGIPQVNDIINKLGIPEEELEKYVEEMDNVSGDIAQELENQAGDAEVQSPDQEKQSSTNTPDFAKFFGNIFGARGPKENEQEQDQVDEKSGKSKKLPKLKYLPIYGTDLTDKASKGKIDNIIGREREIERTIEIINRRTKNNPVLVGEAGVGKTAIAEGLALKISRGEVPAKLLDKKVFLLDLTAMVAGTQFRGQFESRMKGLIDEVKACGNIILVIDEIHNIMGAGEAEGALNAANIMKPALARGEIQLIGATTLKEYRKYIEKDTALERRFQPIMVDEPTIEETIEILKGIRSHYEEYHKVHFTDTIIEDAVRLAERYITDRFLPDKAIDVIDEACSRSNLGNLVLPKIKKAEDELKEQTDNLNALETKDYKDDNERNEGFKAIADAKSEIARLEQEIAVLKKDEYTELTFDDVAHVIELWSGVPVHTVSESEAKRILGLEDTLRGKIIGQDNAVSLVSRAIKRNRSGFRKRFKPTSFIFVGPTGVGKTELVKQLATELFGTADSLIRLDMSEYMEKHTVAKLIGSPPGYVGYDEAGQLTEQVRRRPYSVILLDEIEKAHPDVFNMLLQILDDGRLTDSQGRVVNFENTIIIMTSNAGNSIKNGAIGFGIGEAEQVKDTAQDALKSIFRPEFLNRVDEVIVFNPLNIEMLTEIAKLMTREVLSECDEKAIKLEISDDVYKFMASESFDSKYGARPLRRYIQKNIEDVLSEYYLEGKIKKGDKLSVSIESGKIDVEINKKGK